MKQTTPHQLSNGYATWAIAGAMSAFLVAPGMATSLTRGAQPDTTAQQRYQSAIREAGGGLKVAREECRQQPVPERKGCEAQAQASYQQEMSHAKAMFRDPQV